jgi:hypothetical protein
VPASSVVRPWELSGGLSVDFSAAAKPVAEEKSLSARADLTAELHPEREDWLNRYAAVRRASVDLAAPLSAEDQVVQSMPDTSPTKWHLAHTTWFFETFLLKPHASGYVRFDERFGFLFNSYYEAVGARHPRPQRGLITRPSLDQVHAYRAHVDAAMTDLIAGADETVWPRVAPLLELGLNHEQQHQELILMDIKHLLAQNPIAPAYLDQRRPHASAASALTWTSVPGGLHAIGHAGDGFAFDNEGPRHKVWLEPFKIALKSKSWNFSRLRNRCTQPKNCMACCLWMQKNQSMPMPSLKGWLTQVSSRNSKPTMGKRWSPGLPVSGAIRLE